MHEMELIVPTGQKPERLDQFISRTAGQMTRSTAQRLIDAGMVTVDGASCKSSHKLTGDERVIVRIPPAAPAVPVPEEIPLEILYEDHDVVVINKPAGMVVHPGAGNPSGTLVNALLAHCSDLSGIGGEIRPGIVHRLDKDTSGVLVVAKNDVAHHQLSLQFSRHSIKRVYVALVYGSMKAEKGRIEGTIGRHPSNRQKMSGTSRRGKHAVTHWQVIEHFPGFSLLKLKLETGRTHQIRVHLSESGHPLVGDPVYGGAGRLSSVKSLPLRETIRKFDRQALHARIIGFIHPTTGVYLEFETELPPDMSALLDCLRHTAP
jgi:23S rRNA pseudouridine1911/1915/1917 synthase